jgi:hypothetical protein
MTWFIMGAHHLRFSLLSQRFCAYKATSLTGVFLQGMICEEICADGGGAAGVFHLQLSFV